MSRNKVIGAVAALIVVGGIAAALALAARGSVPEIDTAAVARQDLSVSVSASGRVAAGRKADVFPPSAGTLDVLLVEEGQEVTAGAPVARLDDGPLTLAVAQARAGLSQAQAQLAAIDKQVPSAADKAAARANVDAARSAYDAARSGVAAAGDAAPSKAQIEAAAAATVAAKTAYDSANANYNALKTAVEMLPVPDPSMEATLTAAKVAAEQAYAGYLNARAAEQQLRTTDTSAAVAQARAAVEQARAAWEGAKAQLHKLETLDLSAERAAARAACDQASEALRLAEENLAKATLTAPIAGVVIFNPVGTPGLDGTVPKAGPGVAVGPQAAPFTIIDLGAVRFTAEVDEADIDRVNLDMRATVRLDAFPGVEFDTTVGRIESTASQTPTGGTVFVVDLWLEGSAQDILVGMRGDATIEVSAVDDVLTIPIEALFDEGGESFVYVVRDERLVRTRIEIGSITETTVEVDSGLSGGEAVALSGPVEYSDGMQVRTR